jgi:hypothetical protein
MSHVGSDDDKSIAVFQVVHKIGLPIHGFDRFPL